MLELAGPNARGVMIGAADLRQLIAVAEGAQDYVAGAGPLALYRALAALVAEAPITTRTDCDPGDEQA